MPRGLTLILFVFITSLSFNLTAANLNDQIISTPAKSLSMVYGWIKNEKNDKWSTSEKEIKSIDKFEDYSIMKLYDSSSKTYYTVIIKKTKQKGVTTFDSYILDYNDYEKQITQWKENTIVKFKILKHQEFSVKLNKDQRPTNEELGIAEIHSLMTNPRDSFVYQYKFMADGTVKFLFYVEKCNSDACIPNGLETNEKSIYRHNAIGSDDLFDSFFYKTPIEYFTPFIDYPINILIN